MDVHLNRRQWLKTSSAAVAGWMVGGGVAGAGSLSGPDRESREMVRLLYNESHFGISQAARRAVMDALDDCSAYPDDHYHELKEHIAAREGLKPENIILGAGSIEIITAALHVHMSRGRALASDPTYFDFVDYAARVQCPLRQVALTDGYELDLAAMEREADSRTGLVYLCNPQNPTGVMTPQEKLRPFCRETSRKALVILDEAYFDYVEDSAYASLVDLVRDGENILVTRTFSKIHGLAGLRIGYGMARPDIIAKLAQWERNFAPVSSLSLKAAMASYRDEEFVARVKRQNREVKLYMYGELRRLGLAYLPSQANFILFKVRRDSQDLAKELEKRSLLVQPLKFRGADWIRVSLGTLGEMQAFVAQLEDLIGSRVRSLGTGRGASRRRPQGPPG